MRVGGEQKQLMCCVTQVMIAESDGEVALRTTVLGSRQSSERACSRLLNAQSAAYSGRHGRGNAKRQQKQVGTSKVTYPKVALNWRGAGAVGAFSKHKKAIYLMSVANDAT